MNQTNKVIKLIAEFYTGTVDYDVVEDEVLLLGQNDEIIQVITTDELTHYWNIVEGW